eukprot:g11471.t1
MVTALEQRDGKCLEGCISFLEAASITHQILKSTLIGKPVREVSVLTGCCRTAAAAEAGAGLGIESGVGGEKKRERSPRREQESLLPGVKKLSTVASMTSLGSEAGGNPRLVTRHKLHAALSYDEGSSECEMLALHDKLAGPTGSTKDYAIQVRAILSNLKDGRNKDFKLKLRLGILDPALAPTLTAHDMASDDKRKEREKILQDAMDAMDLDYDKKRMKISSTFTCNKCNTNRCTYYQLQTRSSDEPMTTFVTCQTCGNRWKFC